MEAIKEARKLLGSKIRGKKWVDEALPVVVEVAKEIKELESVKGAEAKPLREMINEIGEKYKGALTILGEMDTRLRERVMKEYEGTESIKQEGVGELVFPELWGFEVTDIKKVPIEFLTVDSTAVRNEIKKGIRNIKGLEISRHRSLQVRQDKNGK
jgi:hypothetical protein